MHKLSVTQARSDHHTIVKNAKVIGKGQFSVVFERTETTVFVASCCPFKEANFLGWLPESPFNHMMFPEIEREAYGDCSSLYIMPLYERVTAPKKQLNSEAYAVYTILRIVAGEIAGARKLWDMQNRLAKCECISGELKDFLIELIDSTGNYTSAPGFEISPRNIATNEHGDLILLDIVFDKDLV